MYIPIIKSRQGDITALKHLTTDVFKSTFPLIFITGREPKDRENFIERINDFLAGKNASIYIDFSSFTDTYLDSISHILQGLSNDFRVIPVITPSTSEAVHDLLLPLIETEGCCLRIKTEVGDDTQAIINATITRLQLEKRKIDLLIDCQYVNGDNLTDVSQHLTNLIPTLNIVAYRNVGIGAGSFVSDLSDIRPDTIELVARYEQQLYDGLTLLFGDDLFYSDYGNQHPLLGESTPSYLPSCSIKYTSTDSYVIFRGRQPSYQGLGFAQYYDKCRQVVQHGCYDGAPFSWGDNQIQVKSGVITNGRPGPGSATTWVSITLNRHITKLHSIIN